MFEKKNIVVQGRITLNCVSVSFEKVGLQFRPEVIRIQVLQKWS